MIRWLPTWYLFCASTSALNSRFHFVMLGLTSVSLQSWSRYPISEPVRPRSVSARTRQLLLISVHWMVEFVPLSLKANAHHHWRAGNDASEKGTSNTKRRLSYGRPTLRIQWMVMLYYGCSFSFKKVSIECLFKILSELATCLKNRWYPTFSTLVFQFLSGWLGITFIRVSNASFISLSLFRVLIPAGIRFSSFIPSPLYSLRNSSINFSILFA